jgi:hypothetical protein
MVKISPPKSMEVSSHNGHESDTCVEELKDTQNSAQPCLAYGSEIKEHTDLKNDSITSCDSDIMTTQLSQSSNTSKL